MSTPDTPGPITDINLLDDDLAQDPWPALRALRELGPVVWHAPASRWLVTTDHAVREVLLDYAHFTVEGTVVADLFGADAFIAMDDRVRHNALREVWAGAFRPAVLGGLRAAVRGITDDLMRPVAERLRAGETVDIAAAFCRALPTLVIASMMGVPRERLDDVVRWSDAMAGGSTSFLDAAARDAAVAAREWAKESLADYLLQLMSARRAAPGDDLISRMVHADAARSLDDVQLMPNIRQLLFAGNETTARWLGHIFHTLAGDTSLQRTLAEDRSLVVSANEEVLRWQGVVGTLPRRVRGGDVELAGVRLREGDDVTCVLPCANRDPARYRDPDRFDLHRPASPSLAFGAGLHNCLGAGLARLEAEVAVNVLLGTVGPVALAGQCRYTAVPMRGPEPVTLVAA